MEMAATYHHLRWHDHSIKNYANGNQLDMQLVDEIYVVAFKIAPLIAFQGAPHRWCAPSLMAVITYVKSYESLLW